MPENESEVLQLQELLRKKNSQLNNEEIEKISHQLMELGFFLVRLQIKKYSQPSQPDNRQNSEENSVEVSKIERKIELEGKTKITQNSCEIVKVENLKLFPWLGGRSRRD